MQVLTIYDDAHDIQIFKPKAKRLFPHKKYKRQEASSKSNNNYTHPYYLNNCDKENHSYLDNISIEEINNDFIKLNQKLEEEILYNEIMDILLNPKKIISKRRKKSKQIV